MKVFLISLFLLSPSLFAANVDVKHLPESPLVFTSDFVDKDGNTIHGPWYTLQLEVTNNEAELVTLAYFGLETKNEESSTQADLAVKMHIGPGETAIVGPFIVGDLPKSESSVYDVNARLMGWVGPNKNPHDAVNVKFSFKTQ